MKKEYTDETRMVPISMTNRGSGTQIGGINGSIVDLSPESEKVPEKTVSEIIDGVKTEICDNYCKYSDISYTREYSDEEYDKIIEEVCDSCPLKRL